MKLSFVIPCYRSEKTIEKVVTEIDTAMIQMENNQYEIILINDSSPDDTYKKLVEISKTNSHVQAIDLAKNFGQHAALMAGFHFVTGDRVICLDDDGQTPALEVGRLLAKLDEGYDVVYAQYEHKQHSTLRNFGSWINQKMAASMLGKPEELYVSSYFAMNRFIMDELIKYENPYPYVIGLVLRTTNNICNVKVNHRERMEGNSGYTFRKLLGLWINGFTSFSVKPLRTASALGVITALAGLLYAIWTIIHKLVNPVAPLGWSSIIAVLLILGGVILFVLGMIGEYLGRVYICLNNSPQFVVRSVTKKN
jgi:undecaprenyl-phosphate 4-deoxy-4-formamido-L-arabinose transferase